MFKFLKNPTLFCKCAEKEKEIQRINQEFSILKAEHKELEKEYVYYKKIALNFKKFHS
jgi:hypothetical protein